MSVDARIGSSFRFDGRSFVGLVLSPKTPFDAWLTALDGWIGRSWIFTSRPIIIDFSKTTPTRPEVAQLLAQIKARGLRVVAVDGVDQDWLTGTNGSSAGNVAALDSLAQGDTPMNGPAETQAPSGQSPARPAGLMIEQPVRSGQTVAYPEGDVTVLGSIASGAEVIAGGSIHVYGALRGRAIAGNQDNPKARLFCRHFEPELVARERDPLALSWLRRSSYLLAATFLALLVLGATLPWLL